MKKNIILSLTLIGSNALLPVVPTYIAFRSQGVDSARHLVGTTGMMYKQETEYVNGLLSATFQYTHNFDAQKITKNYFGPALRCDSLVVSGSAVTNRSPKDWLADYFLLPQDFKSSISFKPSIKEFLIDFQWHLELDEWCEGLYVTVYAPFVHMHNSMKIKENIINHGVIDYAPGIFSPQPLTAGSINKSFTSFIEGNILTSTDNAPLVDIKQTLAGRLVSIAIQPLKRAIIADNGRTKVRLADLRAIVGWNKFHDEAWRLGLYGFVAAPTGTRPKGIYLFEPIIGNGHHWELGGGFNGAWRLWHHDTRDYSVSFQTDIAISHLFSTRQHRTFDIIGKQFSRYMLAMKFKQAIADNLQGGGAAPSSQFDNELAPVANLTTLTVRASAAFQVDGVAMFTASMPHWNFDLGYNLWIRSAENVKPDDNAGIPLNLELWALKGDARIFGFIPTGGGATLPVNTPVTLSATQHEATINKGLSGLTNVLNQNIDAPQPATADTNNVRLQTGTNSPNTGVNQINTSVNPIFITEKSLEHCYGKTRGASSSIFGNVQYHWKTLSSWEPALSLGFKTEFDMHGHDEGNVVTTGGSWRNIWLKAMVTFE